jgi:starch phosphorylase
VAVRHGEISRSMFPGYPIRSITNGVHAATWVAPDMHDLYDKYIPGWPGDPFALRYAMQIPHAEIEAAHARSKQALLDRVGELTGRELDPKALTIGFARRATGYKRSALVFHDLARLEMIAERHGPMQFVFAGKAHPNDQEGKGLIEQVFEAGRRLHGLVEVVYLPDYGMELGLLLTSGSDVWLNNPVPPLEASGTSGMKAAMNGVPSLSILDGWWVEGCVEGVTGWEIEDGALRAGDDQSARLDARHADALYRKLDQVVAPMFAADRDRLADIRRQAISLNGSFFNTHRMALQYLHEAYLPL